MVAPNVKAAGDEQTIGGGIVATLPVPRGNSQSVLNYPLGAQAHLGLARAYALQGDTAKARTAYQDFLSLWKYADPDLPVLKQAQVEYAKLQ